MSAQYAWAAAAELGVWPDRVTLGGGYRHGVNGRATVDNDDNATLIAGAFLLAQNLQLQLNRVFSHGSAGNGRADDQKTIVMLFAAF